MVVFKLSPNLSLGQFLLSTLLVVMETAALPTPLLLLKFKCCHLASMTEGSMIPTNIEEPSSVMTLLLSALPFRGEPPWKF